MSKSYQIISFYHFVSFSMPELKTMREKLLTKGAKHNIKGLILLSKEGINLTFSGTRKSTEEYLRAVERITGEKRFFYKKSPSPIPAFKKLRVKIKKEIITFGERLLSARLTAKGPVRPDFGSHELKPDEWESILNEKQVTVLDIRNDYEVRLGRFKKAIHFNLKKFTEFPRKLKAVQLPKEQKTLLYCTGGIRCEKALREMRKQGFKELYQLKGGILHYLKSFPKKSFSGECFVFDHRVAVDQNLKPSRKYSLCPHCGNPAGERMDCAHCRKPTKICRACLKKKLKHLMTCTKNCAHHFRMGHRCKTHFKRA